MRWGLFASALVPAALALCGVPLSRALAPGAGLALVAVVCRALLRRSLRTPRGPRVAPPGARHAPGAVNPPPPSHRDGRNRLPARPASASPPAAEAGAHRGGRHAARRTTRR
ncbi:hypothetical protein GCM10027168_28630 [Streptomyces capparidis]